MNILVTTGMGTGIHAFGNMGDVAMLQAGVARLAKLWPAATISVLTESAETLHRFCPDVIPLQVAGRNYWIGEDLLLGRFARLVPERVRRLAIRSRRVAALRFSTALKWSLLARLRIQNRRAEINAVAAFSEALAAADLVVATGAGGFFDSCRDWNMQTLDTIEAAVQRNIPVVMFGQHFGPLTDPEVLSRARRILPAVSLITLRGTSSAQTFLESLGISASRIQITGDEAIELAYAARPQKSGPNLGINFRLRTSAGTNDHDLEMVRPILHCFAKEHQVSLIPVPIAVDSSTCDHLSIQQLLRGFDDQSDGGAHLASPRLIIEQVGRCKILVTCAYHAAVFALAQGIPVVALSKSRYFTQKFLGLKDRFGLGCEIVSLDHSDAAESLRAAINRAWQSAEGMRIPLQESAIHQTGLTWHAYSQTKIIVTNRT